MFGMHPSLRVYIFPKNLKVNESRYEQRGVTPHFFTGQNLLKKFMKKDKY